MQKTVPEKWLIVIYGLMRIRMENLMRMNISRWMSLMAPMVI